MIILMENISRHFFFETIRIFVRIAKKDMRDSLLVRKIVITKYSLTNTGNLIL